MFRLQHQKYLACFGIDTIKFALSWLNSTLIRKETKLYQQVAINFIWCHALKEEKEINEVIPTMHYAGYQHNMEIMKMKERRLTPRCWR